MKSVNFKELHREEKQRDNDRVYNTDTSTSMSKFAEKFTHTKTYSSLNWVAQIQLKPNLRTNTGCLWEDTNEQTVNGLESCLTAGLAHVLGRTHSDTS